MMVQGTVNIGGIDYNATVDIDDLKPPMIGKSAKYRNGKFRAYKIENGKHVHLGYYDDKAAADRAAQLGKNLTQKTKREDNNGIFVTSRGAERAPVYRVIVRLAAGHTVRLGEYQTWGNAVLVRDVVARRAGLPVAVVDYEMPLTLISNAVARSFITDPVQRPSPEALTEFQRRVDELNASRPDLYNPTTPHVVSSPELPPLSMPSQVRRSPFDALER